jgi:hypothetical protein
MAEKNEYKFKCEDLETKLNRANTKLNEVQKFHEKVIKNKIKNKDRVKIELLVH